MDRRLFIHVHQSRGAQSTAAPPGSNSNLSLGLVDGLGLQTEITGATFSSNPGDQDMPSK